MDLPGYIEIAQGAWVLQIAYYQLQVLLLVNYGLDYVF